MYWSCLFPIPSIPSLFPPHEYSTPLSSNASVEFLALAIWLTRTYGISINYGSTENWIFFPMPSCPALFDPNEYRKFRWFLSTRRTVCAFPQETWRTSPPWNGRDRVKGNLMAAYYLGSTPSCPIWFRPHTTTRVDSSEPAPCIIS